MNWPLFQKIKKNETSHSSSAVLDDFLDYTRESKLELYPAQEEAILELYSGKNVILNTPTGSGKSLVAAALHFYSLSLGRRSVYTCPIKALVNEKFLSLCREFGPNQVGMITGDATVNPDAPILCCTAEILAIDALRYGSLAKFDDIIIDEFHYYSDRDRGVMWQIPLLTLPQSRFLLMSATFGDTQPFVKALTELNHLETVVVSSNDRPVPLSFEYSEAPLSETVSKLVLQEQAPIYLVSFTQRECAEQAQNFLSVDFCTKEEKKSIAAALEGVKFSSPYGKDIQRILKHGIGIHHAGLLPKYRVLVERLAQKGLLKVICGTDTLGVGVNVPIRTVLLTQLCKFDGEKTGILSVRDFQQISGRAGRRGYDTKGLVIVQAPEHVIENIRNEQKAAGDPKKLKKLVKRKPPEKGFVMWNRETFTKLTTSPPEPLISRFKITHAILLNVLSRKNEDGVKAMRKIIRLSHESPHMKRRHMRSAFELFKSLLERKIIELKPLRINVELQEDFSLNSTLSLYLLDVLKVLDPTHVDYAFDVLSFVESILENPDPILRKQLDRIKTEKMAELKLSGMEYEERIEELEKLEYPEPNRDLIYRTFNEFSAIHPWVGQENIKPKSIAREMYENFYSFSEYIREYGLQRSEGLLLRYLSDCYKALVQTVPDAAKTEELDSIITFLRSIVRSVDSSLIDEWEKMRDPNWVGRESEEKPAHTIPNSRYIDSKEFKLTIFNDVFRILRSLASSDYEAVLSLLSNPATEDESTWTTEALEKRLKEYFSSEHSRLCTTTQARSQKNTLIEKLEKEGVWNITQIFIDPDAHNDWGMFLTINLEQSQNDRKPALRLLRIGPL